MAVGRATELAALQPDAGLNLAPDRLGRVASQSGGDGDCHVVGAAGQRAATVDVLKNAAFIGTRRPDDPARRARGGAAWPLRRSMGG